MSFLLLSSLALVPSRLELARQSCAYARSTGRPMTATGLCRSNKTPAPDAPHMHLNRGASRGLTCVDAFDANVVRFSRGRVSVVRPTTGPSKVRGIYESTGGQS